MATAGQRRKTTRDADFTERYNNYNKPFVGSGSIGNPDLVAERSFSYEAGADYFGLKNVKIAATVFQQRFSQLIDFVTTPYAMMPRKVNLSPTGTYALAENIASVRNTGVETDVQYLLKMVKDRQLFATVGATWLHTESDRSTPSFYVSSHAKFLSNFTLQYTAKKFLVSANGLYKVRNPQMSTPIHATISKDYFVLNLQGQIFLYQNKVAVYAQLDNVFDKPYSDLLGSVMPGRWLMGGFKVAL